MGGREVYHVPTGFGFSPKASGFYPFDDATALAGESGVGDVAWLIQASAIFFGTTCISSPVFTLFKCNRLHLYFVKNKHTNEQLQ